MDRPLRTARRFAAPRYAQRPWRPFVAGVLLVACAQKVPKETREAAAASSLSRAAATRPAPPAAAAAAEPARVAIPAATQDACRSICERSTQLKCKNAGQCAANCVGMAALTPCSDAISTLYSCLVREPLAHWNCAEDGVAAIREGYCDSEQAKAVACMEAKMQP